MPNPGALTGRSDRPTTARLPASTRIPAEPKRGYTVAVLRNPPAGPAVSSFVTPLRAVAVVAATLALVLAADAGTEARQPPPVERQLVFLTSARVIASKPIGKGTTGALRLTLSDGTLTHDASFQRVDQQNLGENLRQGKKMAGELRFVDAYRYNIAAWELARLLGLDEMMPATVERAHGGQRGALSWWVDDVLMDEAERECTHTLPPGGGALDLARQRLLMQVFTELVRDTDRNKGNVLYTNQWRVIMLDFTRAFRLQPELRLPDSLTRCSRDLLARLRALAREDVARAAGKHLTGGEVNAVMKRRDAIVQRFDELIAARGEAAILF